MPERISSPEICTSSHPMLSLGDVTPWSPRRVIQRIDPSCFSMTSSPPPSPRPHMVCPLFRHSIVSLQRHIPRPAHPPCSSSKRTVTAGKKVIRLLLLLLLLLCLLLLLLLIRYRHGTVCNIHSSTRPQLRACIDTRVLDVRVPCLLFISFKSAHPQIFFRRGNRVGTEIKKTYPIQIHRHIRPIAIRERKRARRTLDPIRRLFH